MSPPVARRVVPRFAVVCPRGTATRYHCGPSRGGVTQGNGHRLGSTNTSSKGETSVVLNSTSVAVRRFLREQQKVSVRWWESPGRVDALLTLFLDRSHSGELHPLLAVEVTKRLGYAVGPEGCGWAIRCGHSGGSIILLTERLLTPLIPLVATHSAVRPLLPVIVEWLLSVANMPMQIVVGHVALYVNSLSEMSLEDMSRHEWPSLEFLLHNFARRSLHISDEAVKQEVNDVICKMVALFGLWGQRHPAETGQPRNCCSASINTVTDSLEKCFFWRGEAPLLIHGSVRTAYARFYNDWFDTSRRSTGGPATNSPSLSVFVGDDDTLRRVLLRLSVDSRVGVGSNEERDMTSAPVVPVEVKLKLDEPSVILRCIVPLAEFVSQVLDTGIGTLLPLSFGSIQTIIYNAISELQRLQGQSAEHHYALLPHKPRVHALKDLCERLVSDVKEKMQQSQCPSGGSVGDHVCFPGATPQQQLQVLHFFYRAARHLVRAVMVEKKASLMEEGCEGSVLLAGGTVASRNDVATLLRNVAFRVLETSLLRYYNALDECSSHSSVWRSLGDNGEITAAISDIEHHAGGHSPLFTARHVLQHPFQQDVIAVVEGLRLVAIQALVLHSQQCVNWLKGRAYSNTAANAFFGVWERTKVGGSSLTNHNQSGREDSESGKFDIQRMMRHRLLWTMLLLHHEYCSCCDPGGREQEAHWQAPSNCMVLRSLLDMLVPDPTCTEFSAFGWSYPLGCDGQNLSLQTGGSGDSELWKRHVVYPPAHRSFSGDASRWDLLDELSPTRDSSRKWLWLGTTGSVREACAIVNPTGGTASRFVGYLLPWSTVAKSRHPLRFYDESGQSAAAAASFDAAVGTLVRGKNSKMPLRLVGVQEEVAFFRDMEHTSELLLCPGILVTNPWTQSKDHMKNSDRNVPDNMEGFLDNEVYDFLD